MKNNLYNIEKTKKFDSKKTNKCLNDLEKKLIELKNTTTMMMMSIEE